MEIERRLQSIERKTKAVRKLQTPDDDLFCTCSAPPINLYKETETGELIPIREKKLYCRKCGKPWRQKTKIIFYHNSDIED